MKPPRIIAVLAMLLLLFSLTKAYCQDYIEYRIQINSDNSASWTIIQVSDINATIDSWEGFQQRIFALVDAAVNETNREMAIEPETIQMETVIAWETQARTTEFRFKWLHFSSTENDKLIFGDVLRVQSFFTQLYGDGALQITYPAGYSVLSLSPTPDNQDADSRTLEWYRTQDFLNGKPSITLASNPQPLSEREWQQYAILGLILATVAVALFFGLYILRRHKPKVATSMTSPAGESMMDSDEEKVIKFIRSSGGSIHQSDITEQFGFSKAKTSQLLASLEKKGVVARYKKGRDKIVTLIEQTAGDRS
jgi:uncharacterized membrane protein